MEFRIGQLNYEMICHAKNLAEAVFFVKTPVSMLVNIGCQNNSGTCSLGHLGNSAVNSVNAHNSTVNPRCFVRVIPGWGRGASSPPLYLPN